MTTYKKIKYNNVDCAVAYADNAAHATSADTAVTASALGQIQVGTATRPIYLMDGQPTQISYTLGTACEKAAVSSVDGSANLPTASAVQSFVNSSIATATATFKGTFNVVSDLGLTASATHDQVIAALAQHSFSPAPNLNDYCFVYFPVSGSTADRYERYKFSTAWEYEYTLNNSGFTEAQWKSINSGATQVIIDTLFGYITGAEKVPKAVAADTATSAGSASSVPYTGITGNPWSVTDVTV